MALRALLARWAQRRAALLQERVGAFFVATGYAVIAGVAFVHFSSLVPRAAPSGGGERLAHYYVSGFLLLELLLQYSLAVWSDPGVVRPEHVEGGDGEGLEEQQWAFCKKCARVKPPRAHHCRVCRRCVFEMDHHCPWVNNCVGYRNYRHFWLLLLYLWVSCAYVATLALRPFLDVMGDVKGTAERTTAERIDRFAFTFAFLTSATLGVALCAYWLWHSYLVLTRQTTIEFAMNSSDRRRMLHNKGPIDALQRLLGRRDPSWVLAVVIPPQPRTLPPPYCKRHALGSSV